MTSTSTTSRTKLALGGAKFLIDIIAPTILFYGLVQFGVGLYLALLASAAFSTISGLWDYFRGARQGAAPIMLLMTLVGFAIAFVSGSDRFLLARESVLTALTGIWFLSSIRAERPLTYRFTRILLEGRFHFSNNWEAHWREDNGFRHIWKVSTAMWGVATLIDAVLRVVIAYTFPVNSVVALQTGLMLVTVVLMQFVTNGYYYRVGLWTRLTIGRPTNHRDSASSQSLASR